MKPILTLTNPTDDELNAAVAERVAGWKLHKDGYWLAPGETPKSELRRETQFRPPYATSADAVLPLIEKWANSKKFNGPNIAMTPDSLWMVSLHDGDDIAASATESAFPRAACIALLRANNIEVIFT